MRFENSVLMVAQCSFLYKSLCNDVFEILSMSFNKFMFLYKLTKLRLPCAVAYVGMEYNGKGAEAKMKSNRNRL